MEKPEVSSRYADEETKRKFIVKLLHPIKSNGFQQMRMDDIAKYMDLSKATLYKYFQSKDEVIERLIDLFVSFIIDTDQELLADDHSFIDGFQKTFTQTLLIANYGSEPFYHDLREVYPELMGRVNVAISERNERVRKFYERGMAAGTFHSLNASLLILQDELMFRHLLDPMYLMKNNLTLRNALFDYYHIRKLQLFSQEVYDTVDDSAMTEKLEYIVRKVSFGVG